MIGISFNVRNTVQVRQKDISSSISTTLFILFCYGFHFLSLHKNWRGSRAEERLYMIQTLIMYAETAERIIKPENKMHNWATDEVWQVVRSERRRRKKVYTNGHNYESAMDAVPKQKRNQMPKANRLTCDRYIRGWTVQTLKILLWFKVLYSCPLSYYKFSTKNNFLG